MLKIFILILLFFSFVQSGISSIAPKTSNVTQAPDTVVKKDTMNSTGSNSLQIDTAIQKTPEQTVVPIDTVKRIDSTLIEPVNENVLTNTKLFIYILLSVLGIGLFFFIFVITLFKTFHKKKSTRQSLLLSWNLFFIVTIIWIFIIWGLVAGFWAYPSFMIVVIFLFIISLIMTIIAVKSK